MRYGKCKSFKQERHYERREDSRNAVASGLRHWDAMWVMNRLVDNDLNAPADFLEYHQARTGHKRMRSLIIEVVTDLGVDKFMKSTLKEIRMVCLRWKRLKKETF